MERLKSIAELTKLRETIRERYSRFKKAIALCGGPGCLAIGSEALKNAFERELRENHFDDEVRVIFGGCHGFCEQGPLSVIKPEGILYCRIKEENIASIVSETVIKGKVIESLLYEDPMTGKKFLYESDIPFYKAQNKMISGQNSLIDPVVI
ncbi:(2Fe-2S) ferredoxin domain-containing protein, partial [Candidatus Poribacteria bacterium]|nr:(2Fe-2S) ferredoxin domain-containing protein [Candidatus Poribacteria bacterium]